MKEKRHKLTILDEEESESGHQHVILRVMEGNKNIHTRARYYTLNAYLFFPEQTYAVGLGWTHTLYFDD